MELIRKLGTKKNKNGNYVSFGEFFCLGCNRIVIRNLVNGKIAKSCGCIANELRAEASKNRVWSKYSRDKISVANKGKKRTEEHKKIYSKSKKKYWDSIPREERKFTEEHRQKIGLKSKGRSQTIEARQKISKANSSINNGNYGKYGELSSQWQGGISFLPYSPEFNKELKQQILERDNHTCQNPNCDGNHKKLHVHHIDYDKKNNNLENFITLCIGCHIKTNSKNKRIYYTKFYSEIVSVYL